MNLTTNAYHAMEETGGEMTIVLKETEINKSDVINVLNPDMEPNNYTCLSVSDTETGMDKDIMEKIFDPFFTTKGKGKGTGMGLSVVHGIVKSAGGAINVYSEFSKGTTFNVYLPGIKILPNEKKIITHAPIKRGTGDQLNGLLTSNDDKQALQTIAKTAQ